jgi:hypothetical protein
MRSRAVAVGRPLSVFRRIWEAVWKPRSLASWLLPWIICLASVGCQAAQPTLTLVPSLALPTPSHTLSPVSTITRPTATSFATNFPTWRTVTLQAGQSYDFRQETVGLPTAGDLYYSAFNPLQGSACFWANNAGQMGGRDLGSWPLTALTQRPLPRERFSGRCNPVIRGHVYVYGLRSDERLAVFRVVGTRSDSVTFDYILRK